jgi:hypothetical protein
MLINDGGTLEVTNMTWAASHGFTNSGGIIQFFTASPTLSLGSTPKILTNATVAFRGISNADVQGSLGSNSISLFRFQGANTFRLNNASNTSAASPQNYTFASGISPSNYVGLEMINGGTAWKSAWLNIGSGGRMLVSNTTANVEGVTTNSGTITVSGTGASVTWQSNVVLSTGTYRSWGGSTNQFSSGLQINSGGRLEVTSGVSMVGGVVTNSGTISVVNARSVFQGPVVLKGGAYYSDPSTNTFNDSFTVDASSVVTNAPGDVYAFGTDFNMLSTNRAFNMSSARVIFTDSNLALGVTSGVTNHTINLAGSGALDKGSNWIDHTQLATNFSIGTLSIALGNRLTLTGHAGGTNALYVGILDLSAWGTNAVALTNTLQGALNLNINLYYDKYDTANAYLQGVAFNLWDGKGLLIPIPEPSALGAGAAGLAFLIFLRRRSRGAGR